MGNGLPARRDRYFRLREALGRAEGEALGAPEEVRGMPGWGRNHLLEIAGERVFIKRIPITDEEREDPLCTRNRYGLPLFYNYGVGSAGMGVGRELVAHRRATEWVLSGEWEGFPLLYDWRVLPATGRAPFDEEAHRGYVAYWGGNAAVGRYLRERGTASHELVMILEYLPEVLAPWLAAHPGRLEGAVEDLHATLGFLRRKGMIHFDAHLHNVLTDGERTYLTDFGLTLDSHFDLSDEERAFFARHALYDYGRCASCMGFVVPEEIREGDRQWIERVEELGLDPGDTACLVRNRAAYRAMNAFFLAMTAGAGKEAAYPETELEEALSFLR